MVNRREKRKVIKIIFHKTAIRSEVDFRGASKWHRWKVKGQQRHASLLVPFIFNENSIKKQL